ncbi:alkyl sulfatase dimerization domain-containing protein [Streptomyces sp. NPDC051896]|uniref:alkyl sulfatase dimerization domain-containing protein n=1 Tax=Streptomyces sp. NPDC051896 TaxID=3155416 RepID=UPI0034479672
MGACERDGRLGGAKGHWAPGTRAHQLLQQYGVDINDASNGIPLDHPTPHNYRHRGAFRRRLVQERFHLAKYDEPEFIVRNLWRRYAGWYDGNPAHLKPAPDGRLATALADLAGGAAVLSDAARRYADAGELRIAGHLAEFAVQAAPDDATAHAIRADVNCCLHAWTKPQDRTTRPGRTRSAGLHSHL